MNPTKITVIGAGSASFGLNTLGSIMRSKALRGSEIALVDRNPDTLALVRRLAERLNTEWDAQMKLTSFTDARDGLPGAKFVVSAIEVPPREALWQKDYEITLKYGVRQPYAENGGPGGFAHAARNTMPLLKIARDMEELCPDALFINFTNPMVNICDTVARYSKIKVVGLCHQIFAGYTMVGYLLADYLGVKVPPGEFSTHADRKYWTMNDKIVEQVRDRISIKAAGLNHFTWMMDVRDTRTGEDLYPMVLDAWRKADPKIEPLTRRMVDAFGMMPIPGDEHLCEYLPWCSDPITKPWEKMEIELYDWEENNRHRDEGHAEIAKMGQGQAPVDALLNAHSEGAIEVIESLAGGLDQYHLAVNVPNIGQISNLPMGTIVETPAVLSGMGVMPVAMGALPEGVAELLRRQAAWEKMAVDAAVSGDRQLALQCMLHDPTITDIDVAHKILDDYLVTYKEYLPQFWK